MVVAGGGFPQPGVAYLLSHYNVWGTGDGDMTRNWFGGGSCFAEKGGADDYEKSLNDDEQHVAYHTHQ